MRGAEVLSGGGRGRDRDFGLARSLAGRGGGGINFRGSMGGGGAVDFGAGEGGMTVRLGGARAGGLSGRVVDESES